MKFTSGIWFFLAGLVLCTGCIDNEDDDKIPSLSIPTTYDSSAFNANSGTQRAVLGQLKAVVDEVKKGRTKNELLASTLRSLYNAGNPNLPAVGTSYYHSWLINEWFTEIAKASGGDYTPGIPTGEGGVYGTGTSAYLFDENGLEIEQLIEKGMFGSVIYKHVDDLLKGTVSSATADQVLAVIGGNPTFPNTTSAKSPRPDGFVSGYVARRDKNDGKGFYSQLKSHLLKLQAAEKAGSNYLRERQEAIAGIRITLEKANAATIINYCHSVTSLMSNTNPTDNQKASALHALGESIGFAHGYKTIANKKITDAQIDEILVLLNAPANGTPTCYKFVTEPETELVKLQTVISKLKGIYEFSDQDINDFKTNWITSQNR